MQSENTSPYCTDLCTSVCAEECTAACRTVQTSTWGSESASWQPGSGQFLSKNMLPKSLRIPRTDLVRRASSRKESCRVRFRMYGWGLKLEVYNILSIFDLVSFIDNGSTKMRWLSGSSVYVQFKLHGSSCQCAAWRAVCMV